MRPKMDRRTPMEKSVDRYIDRILIASGRRDPTRRTRLEKDVNYSLEVIISFRERFAKAMTYDIYGVDSDYTKAIRKVRESASILQRFGLSVKLPEQIEDPDIIEAECAMAFIDSLRSLDAVNAEAAERFVSEALAELLHRSSSKVKPHQQIKELIHRYLFEMIAEDELDKMALEDDYLHIYLKRL